jgi:hypothetical protein
MAADYFPAPGEEGTPAKYVMLFVVATLGATLLHVAASVVAHRRPPQLRYVVLVGMAARLLLIFGGAEPILEGDRTRLRFEGRLVNRGVNPYEFRPVYLGDVLPEESYFSDEKLGRLSEARIALTTGDDSPRPESIRRPDLRSSSTPAVLGVAALADRMKPESTHGYGFIVLCADVLAAWLLILALRAQRLPMGWLMIYAWCPVLLKEFYCGYSIDAFVMVGIAGIVYCLASGRRVLAAIPMAIAMAVRPAMILLLPVLARRLGGLGVLLALLLSLLPMVPFTSPDVPVQNFVEGHVHVWRHYEYNSALENTLRGALKYMPHRSENSLMVANVEVVRPEERLDALLAKVACLIVLCGVIAYTVIRVRDVEIPALAHWSQLTDVFVVLAALMIVSPVLKPSHALWLLPLLVMRQNGIVWVALPGILCISHLTHLVGPEAADLPLAGGQLSFRVFEFGLFLAIAVLDVLWRGRIFDRPDELNLLQRTETDFDMDIGYEQPVDEEPLYV